MYVGLKTASNNNELFLRLFYHLNIVPKAGKHYSSFEGEGMKVVCFVWGGVGCDGGTSDWPAVSPESLTRPPGVGQPQRILS